MICHPLVLFRVHGLQVLNAVVCSLIVDVVDLEVAGVRVEKALQIQDAACLQTSATLGAEAAIWS